MPDVFMVFLCHHIDEIINCHPAYQAEVLVDHRDDH